MNSLVYVFIISFTENKLVSDTLLISKKTFDYVQFAKKTSKGKGNNKATYAKGIHTVRKGDTMNAIARRYGTSTAAICKKNGLKSTATLRIGQKLKV